MSHNIVFFKNSLLGSVFGSFPKFKMLETIDFTGFPKFFPEIKRKWESQNWFWENEKSVFGRNPDFWEAFLEICVFGVVGKLQQNTGGVRLCEKWVTKGDVKRYR